jgi:hypothetical protein
MMLLKKIVPHVNVAEIPITVVVVLVRLIHIGVDAPKLHIVLEIQVE